jgi:hypothetical protein
MLFDLVALSSFGVLFSELNIHRVHTGLVECILMGESIAVGEFGPKEFESVVPVGLENVVALLVDELPALIAKIWHINTILTSQKHIRLFPIMHGIHKHGLKLLHRMIQPQNIPKIIFINPPKIYLIVKVMGRLNHKQHLLGQLIIILQPLNPPINIIVIIILYNGVNLVLVAFVLP